MTTESMEEKQETRVSKEHHQGGGSSGTVYFLGLIGACVYYLKGVTTFKEGTIGFLKGLVWPAFLVYDLLMFLHKE